MSHVSLRGVRHARDDRSWFGREADFRSAATNKVPFRESLNRLERQLLVEALRRAGGVRKDAAQLLGIDPRNLSYYLKKHDLDAHAIEE